MAGTKKAKEKEGFAIAPIGLILDHRLTLIQLRVLLAIRSYRNPKAPKHVPVFAKRTTLSGRCGYDKRTITRATRALVELGWLHKVSGAGHKTTRYWLGYPSEGCLSRTPPEPPLREVSEPDTSEVPDSDTSKVPEPDTPEVPEPDTTIESNQVKRPLKATNVTVRTPTAIAATPRPGKKTWLTDFGLAWAERVGTPSYGRLGKAMKPLVETYGEDVVLPVWRAYIAREAPKFLSPERFSQQFVAIRSGTFWNTNKTVNDRNADAFAAYRSRQDEKELPALDITEFLALAAPKDAADG